MGEKDDYDSENSWISDGLPNCFVCVCVCVESTELPGMTAAKHILYSRIKRSASTHTHIPLVPLKEMSADHIVIKRYIFIQKETYIHTKRDLYSHQKRSAFTYTHTCGSTEGDERS